MLQISQVQLIYEPTTDMGDEYVGMLKGNPTIEDPEHHLLAATAHATKLQLPKMLNSATKRLRISPVKQKAAHFIPPDLVPVLLTCDWVWTIS